MANDIELQRMLDQTVLGLFQGKCSAFLSSLYCSLKFKWDESIPTGCTDGIKLSINPTWFATLSKEMRVTLLAHELWHVAYMHMMRLDGRIHSYWNMAADHAINLMMKEHGYVFDISHLADPKYTGMSAEQIYDDLVDGMIDLPFGKDFKEPTETEIKNSISHEVVANIVRAMTVAKMTGGSGWSDMPGGLITEIDTLLNPKLPWEVLLQKWLNERSDCGSNWSRRNRRYGHVYLPSRGSQDGLEHLMFALDCSCSVTNEQLQLFNSELKGAKEAHNPERMTVVSFDTEIQDEWEFDSSHEINGLTFHGRGGTDLHALYARAKQLVPSALVIFSDLEVEIPPDPGIPIVWICLDRPHTTVPYGTLIHVDSN